MTFIHQTSNFYCWCAVITFNPLSLHPAAVCRCFRKVWPAWTNFIKKLYLTLSPLPFPPAHSGLSQQQGSVEQISLHCSEGTLDWLYPKGALRLTLSPRLPSMVVGPSGSSSGLITACVKPSEEFHGAQLYLERDGVLELLVGDRLESSPPPRVRCFSRLPGERVALFLQATPHQDISRRIASFRYELRGDWTARLSLDSHPISTEGE